MPFYVGEGGFKAEVTNGLEDLRRLVDLAAPGLVQVLERETSEILAEAEARWPVAADQPRRPGGVSRAGLRAGVVVAPNLSSIRGTVWNVVDYSIYVQSFKNKLGGKSANVELMRKPVKARTARVVAELQAAFGRALGGRNG